MTFIKPDNLSMVWAAALQLVAVVLTLRMIREVRDRRPWVVLAIAMSVMAILRILALFLTFQQRSRISAYSAPTISLLLCVSLYFIRKIARAERESDNRYRALVEHSPDTIFVTTAGNFAYVNPAGVKFFDAADSAELVHHPVTDFAGPADPMTDPDPLSTESKLEQWTKKSGAKIVVEVASVVIPWRGGRARQVVMRDVTDRQKAEEEKSRLLSSERVARSNAEHANRMKDQFLATLSHELRTPLTAILGWSQLLRTSTGEPGDLATGLDTIERNARVQTQLIEDLLDMSRIISGKLRLDVQRVDPVTFVGAALETVRPAATAKKVDLVSDLDPTVPPITGDPARLQQVAWNLLSNAIKFTPPGGQVTVTLKRTDGGVELSVVDTGQGIAAEFLPFVFERFRQADGSTTRRHGGLGLGLSIARQLAELHGGTLTADSPGLGKGAAFTVHLPATVIKILTDDGNRLHPIDGVDRLQSVCSASLVGLRVLVVDDEPDSREIIRRVLIECRAVVTVASSAAEALELVGQTDALISDIGMPDIDGYEFIRRVRQLRPDQGGKIPAIALTAFARSEDRTRALLAGYQVHLSKPISPSELLATVASVTGRTGSESYVI